MLIKKTIVSLSLFVAMNVYADNIILSATSNNVTSGCYVNHRCPIKGYHRIQIKNNTNKPHAYKYSYLMCVTRLGNRTDCDHKTGTINVRPNTVWHNNFNTYSEPRFDFANSYGFIVETEVIGYEPKKIISPYSIKVTLK